MPELKMPTALARSSVGNHSVVALMAAGKLPDSPRPRKMRAMQKPTTEVTREWLIDESAQMQDGDGVAGLGAEPVDDAAGEEEADAVGDLEADDDVAVVVVEDGLVELVGEEVPTHEGDVVQERLDEGEDRAVHVVDGGRGEEQGADEPADIGLVRGRGGEAGLRKACGVARHKVVAPASLFCGARAIGGLRSQQVASSNKIAGISSVQRGNRVY